MVRVGVYRRRTRPTTVASLLFPDSDAEVELRDMLGRRVGGFQLDRRGRDCSIGDIEVASAYRGLGLGRLVFSEAMRIAKEMGCKRLEGYTDNPKQIRVRASVPGTKFYGIGDKEGEEVTPEEAERITRKRLYNVVRVVTPLRRSE